MRYDHIAPDDLNSFKVIEEGEGTFKVLEATEEVSKTSGKDMMNILYELKNLRGQSTLCNQYIVANEWAAKNIYGILDAAGKAELYQEKNGEIKPYDLIGLKGQCKIKTEVSTNPNFEDKSKVGYFIPASQKRPIHSETVEECPDDSIPF